MRNFFGLALLLAAFLVAPSAARASSQCICENGKTLTTASDAEDACETSCDLFGGGHAKTPGDDANSGAADAPQRNPYRRSVTPPAASNPDSESGSGTADPRNRP